MENVQLFQEDKLKIEVEEFKYSIRVTWLGECTAKEPGLFLNPILKDQYQSSLIKLKGLVFDFTKTKYMNSAAIIPIIQILKIAKAGKGYIQVRYNLFERWQTILIGELKIFETIDERVQIIGIEKKE